MPVNLRPRYRTRTLLTETLQRISLLFGPCYALSHSLFRVDTEVAAQSALMMQVVDALGKGLSPGARKAIFLWLGGCAGWVFSMVILGGMTRLTRSGLSMTDWKFTGERAPKSQVQSLPSPLGGQPESQAVDVIRLTHHSNPLFG